MRKRQGNKPKGPVSTDDELEYTIRESARAKRVILKVSLRGKLEVVVPRGFRRSLLPKILEEKRPWIERSLRQFEDRQESGLPECIRLRAIDEEWQVQYQHTPADVVTLRQGGTRRLDVAGDVNAVHIVEAVLRRWLHIKARVELVPWLEAISREVDIPFKKAIVRGQSTRWASCSQRHTMSLNRDLLFLPPHLVRHVLLHELCHVKRLDHSAQFWDLFQAIEPECRSLESEVRRATAYVPVWAHAR